MAEADGLRTRSGPLARYEVLVFDWDGTVVDSTGLIAGAILQAATDLGVPVPDRAQAWQVIGLGLAEALARVVPDLPRARIADFAARYHRHYCAGEASLRLFAGMRALLDGLRASALRLAVATGKSQAGLQRALQGAGLQAHFAALRCADQTHPKPHPAMLLELAEELAVPTARMLMIGDTSHDLQMAAAAAVDAVGVAYGAHPRAQLAALAPMAVVDSVAELHCWLMGPSA